MPNGRKGPFHLYEVLEKEYTELHGPLPADYPLNETDADARLKAIIDLIHARADGGQLRSALCFSGGGIRSATFGLGVLQGLARQRLLEKFDYLSTVSGGGYLGGWFSAWVKRERDKEKGSDPETIEHSKAAVRTVQDALRIAPAPKLQPEAEPVRHLRSYSNYMSPRLGLLSADTWTLVAIYFRNLFLNWLVLIPLILGVLAIPRLGLSIAAWRSPGPVGSLWLGGSFVVAVLCGVFAISYIIANRPSVADAGGSRIPFEKRFEGWFIALCMVPLLILSRVIATHWAWARTDMDHLNYTVFGYPLLPFFIHNAFVFAAFGVLLYLGAYIIARLFLVRFSHRLGFEWFVAIVTGAIGGLLTYLVAANVFDKPVGFSGGTDPAGDIVTAALYVCFAAPTFLLLFLAASTIFVGLSSFRTTDADREWLARAGAWVLITIFAWTAVSTIVIFGPVLLFYFGPKIIAAIGSAAGVITIGGGASGKTAANPKEEAKEAKGGSSAWMPLIKRVALALAAPIFAVFLLILLSLGTSYLAQIIYDALATATWVPQWATDALSLKKIEWDQLPHWGYTGDDGKQILIDKYGLLNILYYIPGWYFLVLTVLIVAVGVLMGIFVNINKFSLHGAYRDRLIRAYLGASRPRSERTPNPFTGFDERDNVPMSELARRPLHVVNMTLNLVSLSSEQLAWQDRKAESFTVSRHHAGSFCVGYRESTRYGRNEKLGRAISLGTAVAISGAAASPNMGYYSSTFVTFLLSLFNVRLGWWLGNPGPAGEKTFDTAGPRFGPKALVAETLGMTNDRHPYVYLSDGGHFENLGLYEMVLRRCHIIVVSDGSADPSLTLNDLGNAISKIREDLGISIVFKDVPITRRDRDAVNYLAEEKANEKYCAVGTICYQQKDGPTAVNGTIIYIKPNIYGGEPADVFNYARSNPAFPHESTGDQMYSESQFESYRMLGFHVVNMISRGAVSDLNSFVNNARTYLAKPTTDTGKMVNLPDCTP